MPSNNKKQTQKRLSEATQDLGHSPEPSSATPSVAEDAEPPRVDNQQPSPDPATRLADTFLGRRNRVANGPTGTRVSKRPRKAAGRGKKKTANAYYVILEGSKPLGICKGWPAARRKTANISNRWCQRFDTRDEAREFMKNPE
ncbi:hypothetical protein diail_3208, partial [Diaporthe ilicicola]